MNAHVFVVDGVYHRGDVRNLVSAVDTVVAGFPTSKTVWLARADQAPFLNARTTIGQADDSFDYESIIERWVSQASENGDAGSVFHVLSWNVKVLRRAAALNGASCVVTTEHLGNIPGVGAASRHQTALSAPTPFSSPSSLSADEADALAKRALREGRHTSSVDAMHQPKLRLAMCRLDPRARKIPGDPRTYTLVREVVARGIRQGWLRQDRRGNLSGCEYIWLVEPSNDDGLSRQAVSSAMALAEPTPIVDQVTASKKRDAIFEEALLNERIGSPPIPRKFIFDAAVAAINETAAQPLTVAALIGRVCKDAKERACEAGFTKEQYWSAITECVFRAMIQAQAVLMPDGVPVPARIGQHSSLAAELRDDFRIRTEALMLERIIQKRSDVTLADVYSLGLALYQQGRQNPVAREDLLARVDALLKILESEGRIHVNADDLIVAVLK